jgi:MFS family permease
VYFAIIAGNNAMTLWMPSVISGFGTKDVLQVGLLSSVPYIAGAIGMYLLSRRSDKKGERRWHSASAMVLTSGSYALLGSYLGHPVIGMVLLTLAAVGVYSSMAVFWTIPPSHFSGSRAASGIALVSSLGMFGGFFSPVILGWAKSTPGGLQLGFLIIAAVIAVGAVTLIVGIPELRRSTEL